MILIPNALKQVTQFKTDAQRKAFATMAEDRYITPLNFTVKNAADNESITEIDIEGTIGENWWAMSEEEFKKNTKENLKDVLRNINTPEILVNINSYGGDVNHGLSIYDLLREHDAQVTTKINGMTASAATIISQAGDRRTMSENATFLPHRAWTIAMGNHNHFTAMADDLELLDGRIAKIYSRHGNKEFSFYLGLMDINNGDGKWFDADNAFQNGFIDDIYNAEDSDSADAGTNNSAHSPQKNKTQQADSANDARIRDQITILQLKAKAL